MLPRVSERGEPVTQSDPVMIIEEDNPEPPGAPQLQGFLDGVAAVAEGCSKVNESRQGLIPAVLP